MRYGKVIPNYFADISKLPDRNLRYAAREVEVSFIKGLASGCFNIISKRIIRKKTVLEVASKQPAMPILKVSASSVHHRKTDEFRLSWIDC